MYLVLNFFTRMNKRILFFALGAFAVFALAACSSKVIATGDVVWAQWGENSWYHGTVGSGCADGFTVNFDDGTDGCYPTGKIVSDSAPASVGVGDDVVARWTDSVYYTAKVTAVSGDTVSVAYGDGTTGDVTMSQVRAR